MGYAGYVPAKLPPASLSPLQAALYGITSVASLELIEKLVYNAVVSPQDPKFRKVRLSNPRIKAAIPDTPGALDAMIAMGWQEEEEEEGQSVLLLQKPLTMAVVRDVQEAASRAKKAAAESQRAAQRAAAAKPALLTGSDSRESLRALLEADRRERALQGPVTTGSIAQPLPNAGTGAARITTAGDAGLNRG